MDSLLAFHFKRSRLTRKRILICLGGSTGLHQRIFTICFPSRPLLRENMLRERGCYWDMQVCELMEGMDQKSSNNARNILRGGISVCFQEPYCPVTRRTTAYQ